MSAADDLSQRYGSTMLGNANTTRPEEDIQLVAEVSAGTPAGKRALRGIPVVGTGAGAGTMAETDPLQALLEKAERMGW